MKRLTLILFTIFAVLHLSAKSTSATPDFAYPQQVSADAQKELTTALKNGNGRVVISSLINYTIAQTLIDKDSLPTTIKRIEQIAQAEKDPCTKALLNTLLVNIYTYIYNDNRWTYNTRDNVLLPLPEDIFTWDEDQFQHKIVLLSNSALENVEALKASSLKDYSTIINFDNETLIYYPTLFDFVARQICEQIENIYPRATSPMPNSWFCSTQEFLKLEIPNATPLQQLLLTTYQSIIRANIKKVAPLISCEISRLSNTSISNISVYDTSRNILRSLYQSFSNSEYSGDILLILDTYAIDDKWFYNAISTNLERFPQYYRQDCLKNTRNRLVQKSISPNMNRVIVPGDSLSISISNRNTTNYTINLYRLPDSNRFYNNSIYNPDTTKHQLIKSIQVKTDSIIPFKAKQNVKFAIEHPGYYYITTNLNEPQSSITYCPLILCSDIFLLHSSHEQSVWATVVNPKTGAPVIDADIFSIHNDYPDAKIATTDKTGHTLIPKGNNEYIAATKNGNRSSYIYIGRQDFAQEDNNLKGQSFADRSLYHPGDSVHWCGIVYSDRDKLSLSVNQSVTVQIKDANNNIFDEVTLITDKSGRVSYSFRLPVDRLTGDWSISLKDDKHLVSFIAFTVSDYKLPTFFIEFTSTEKNFPHKGDITLNGKVGSFSGMPLANTSVIVQLSASNRNIFHHQFEPYYSTKLITDSNGFFTITLSEKILDMAPYPKGVYTVKASATTPSGETQYASTSINRGLPYLIVLEEYNKNFLIDANGYINLKLKATDINNNNEHFDVNYQVLNKEKQVCLSGKTNIANASINASGLKSGMYSLIFTPTDLSLAEPFAISDVILYRNNDVIPPISTPLWIPTTTYTIDSKDTSATIFYGTSFNDCHIDMVICCGNRILSRKWLTPKTGNHTLTLDFPSEYNDLNIYMCVLYNYDYHTTTITISRQETNAIKIKAETFRDRITPGATETWKFSVIDNSGKGVKSSLIFDMYNKALDKLSSPYTWTFSPQPKQYPIFNFDLRLNLKNGYYQYSQINDMPCPMLIKPVFNTYGHTYIRQQQRVYLSLGTNDASRYERSVLTKSETEIDNTEDQSIYHPSEVALAFFNPNLVTDEQGNINFTFTVPNANTTWRFNAIAYSDHLATTHMNCDVIANKPLMVQPNLPRFLRAGDKAVIKAAIQNNTAETQTAITTIEIFNPANNEVFYQWQFADTITAKQSSINEIVVDAPHDIPMLGYRIKSSNDDFADGEQSLIAILPSITPIIETQTFYMAPNDHNKALKLPFMTKDSRVTLQFCENPIWYCITALPGLRNNNETTSNGAMAAIFSAAIAEGIIRNNPDVASAIYYWQNSNQSDSVLTSMLQRNQDLKTILLNATPWLMDARSDTERMTRLALLFNKNEIKNTYAKNITLLYQLQNKTGGWKWIKQSTETSVWSTLNILAMCGNLIKLGYMPEDKQFNAMIDKAVKYIDDYYARQYTRYPKSNYTEYTYVRSLFPKIKQSTAAYRVSTATIQQLISEWKNYNVALKAIAAIILNTNNYHNTAQQILHSIREYAQYTPEQGIWWPSLNNISIWSMDKIGATSIILEAFHTIESKCNEIDQIRQWLILQKEASDWGFSATTCQVISSLLSTGIKWTSPAQGISVALDNSEIDLPKAEKYTGYFRTDISSLSPSEKTLTIAKPASTPAWGAIFSQFKQQMQETAAYASLDLSIDKQLLRQVSITNGISWEKAEALNVGDIVKIQLTIKVNRDLDYVAIIDDRAACFEPEEQLPKPIFTEGIYFYRENNDATTNIFVDHLPKGTYILTYNMNVNNAGTFTSGIASIQSQYAPEITAHSAGNTITITP